MQKQLASMSSSSGSFDVSDNFGNNVGSWASKGMLAPLDDLLKTAGVDTSDFVPAAMNQMKYQGKIYALPVALHTMQLVYNKKFLQEAGVTPPKTIAELATAIAKLTKVDASGNITQFGLGNPDLSASLSTLGYASDGTWDGSNASAPTPTPSEQGNLDALKFWQDNISNKYGVAKVAKFAAGWGQYVSPQDPFYTGKVAMVIEGEWQAVSIPKTALNLQWGVASIPVANSSLDGTTQLTASTLFIPANSQDATEAATYTANSTTIARCPRPPKRGPTPSLPRPWSPRGQLWAPQTEGAVRLWTQLLTRLTNKHHQARQPDDGTSLPLWPQRGPSRNCDETRKTTFVASLSTGR